METRQTSGKGKRVEQSSDLNGPQYPEWTTIQATFCDATPPVRFTHRKRLHLDEVLDEFASYRQVHSGVEGAHICDEGRADYVKIPRVHFLDDATMPYAMS